MAGDVEKLTCHCYKTGKAELVEDKLIDTSQVGYDFAEEGIENLFLFWWNRSLWAVFSKKDGLVTIGKYWNRHQIWEVMDTLTRRVAGWQPLVRIMTTHIKYYIWTRLKSSTTWPEGSSKSFSKLLIRACWQRRRWRLGLSIHRHAHRMQLIWMKNVAHVNSTLSITMRRAMALGPHFQRAKYIGKHDWKCRVIQSNRIGE